MKRYILLLFVHGYKSRGGKRTMATNMSTSRRNVAATTTFALLLIFVAVASCSLAFVTKNPLFVITTAVTCSIMLLWAGGILLVRHTTPSADVLSPLPSGPPPGPPPPGPPPFSVFRELVDPPATDACAICLDTEGGRVELPCAHSYHRGCIIAWFERRITCPLCGQDPREVARRTTPPGTPAPAATPPARAP
jgi:hypothetical protein